MENSGFFKNVNILNLVYRWKMHLIIIVVLSIIFSVLFSSSIFIKPKYKSTAIIYPSNIIPYSSETPTEQMLQIFSSDDIRDKIIKRFDLAKHYDVDSTTKYYKTTLKKEFESNVSIKKTEFESVKIDILDTDPLIACNMVKEMINLFNLKIRMLQREKIGEVVKIWGDRLIDKKQQLDSLEKKIDILRKEYNILDYELQVKEATREHVKEGLSKETNAATLLNNLENKGGEFLLLTKQFESVTESYNETKVEYDQARSDLIKELTYTNLVSKPVPADKKSYPIRWLIVSVTAIATLFFSIIVIILFENYIYDKKERVAK